MSFPEEPFTLRQMAPRRRRKGLIVAVAALVVLVGGGVAAYAAMRPASTNAVSQASTPAPTAASSTADAQPSPSATSATASASTAVDDPDGRAACAQIIKASADDQYDPAKMKPIGVQAAKSSEFSIRIDGDLLADRADLAKAAKGGENEFSTSLRMATAAMNLATACYKAGYDKA